MNDIKTWFQKRMKSTIIIRTRIYLYIEANFDRAEHTRQPIMPQKKQSIKEKNQPTSERTDKQ